MALWLVSIFFCFVGMIIGGTLFNEVGLFLGAAIGFFSPSIFILQNIYEAICGDKEPENENFECLNEEIDEANEGSDIEDLIGDEWKLDEEYWSKYVENANHNKGEKGVL